MQIPVCHHFWKNGENAQWSPAAFPVPEIETRIKNDYLALAARQPAVGKYGRYTVFFDYRPARDIFGRAIMPISFAFYKDFPDDPQLANKIRAALAKTPNMQYSIDLPDAPRAAAEPACRKTKRPRFVAALVLLAALAWLFFFFFGSRSPDQTQQAAQKTGAAKAPAAAESGPLAREQASLAEKPARQAAGQSGPVEQPVAAAAPGEKNDICRRPDLWPALLKCPRQYVEMRCKGETTLVFREFRQENEACRPAYGKLAPWSAKLQLFREKAEIGEADTRALERFLGK